MSAPALLGCAAAALLLGIPVIAASAQIVAETRAAGAADSAALAAADAVSGWIAAEPCEVAAEVAIASGGELVRCDIDAPLGEARAEVWVGSPMGGALATARAGPEFGVAMEAGGVVGANGWAWPSDVRGVTQGFHDGLSIDLAVTSEGALYAPYDGTVLRAGPDGGGMPDTCVLQPTWWRGTNHTVVVRHEYGGRVMYSSHNHVAPGSPQQFGIQPGGRVRAGQRVATAGMSGCTSGLHTHFTLASQPSNSYPDIDPYLYIGLP